MKWILLLIATNSVHDDSSFEKYGMYDNLKVCMTEVARVARFSVELMKLPGDDYTDPPQLEKTALVCIREDKFKDIEKNLSKVK